jgi:hypothetical protein
MLSQVSSANPPANALVEGDVHAFAASLREVVFPIVGIVRGVSQDFGTGILVGGASKGFMWALTATHVFTEGIIKAMRPRAAAQSALQEFLPDNWNSPEAAMKAGKVCAELHVAGQIHVCKVVGYDPHEQSDITLLLIELPSELAGTSLKALPINSDEIPYGTPLVSAGFRKREDKQPGRQFCIGVGYKVDGVTMDERTGAPLYHLTSPSEHGMSGGPILRVDAGGHPTLGVSALISRGDEGNIACRSLHPHLGASAQRQALSGAAAKRAGARLGRRPPPVRSDSQRRYGDLASTFAHRAWRSTTAYLDATSRSQVKL